VRIPVYQSVDRRRGTGETADLLARNVSRTARTAIDIGCNEGVLSLALSRLGLCVLGLEANPKTAPARQSHAEQSKFLIYRTTRLTPESVHDLDEADVVMLLSVHHQFVAIFGEETADHMLRVIASKARQQFFFMPACIHSKYGQGFARFPENDLDAIDAYVRGLFAGTDYAINQLGVVENMIPPEEPIRPLYVITPAGAKITHVGVPHELEEEWHPAELRTVDLDKMRLGPGMKLGRDGYHYLEEALVAGSETYAGSTLERYYNKFRPQNLAEYFCPWHPAETAALAEHAAPPYALPMPWCPFPTRPEWNKFANEPERSRVGSHRCNPTTSEVGRHHLAAMFGVHASLKEFGYLPDNFPDGYVRGNFLLKNDGSLRFFVSGGQHRVAALSSLGVKTIRVRLHPGWPAVVRESDITNWPWVRAGFYTDEQAKLVFDRMCDNDASLWRRYLEC
jgi:hypothetical protein